MRSLLFPTVVALLTAPIAMAEPDLALGEASYQEACAACHGVDAKGGGEKAAMLTVDPPDLTGISARNGGSYPLPQVIRNIDGRAGLTAHGGPMPMFGGLLTGPSAVIDAEDGSPLTTTAPVLAIAQWLETLQEMN